MTILINVKHQFDGIQQLKIFVNENTMVALSRHASKQYCFVKDTKQNNYLGANQCHNYGGSHDAFVFCRKLPEEVVFKLSGIFPHYWGAENVAIYELSKIHNLHFINPCKSVKIYHQHCVDYISENKTNAPRVNTNGRSKVVPPAPI